MFNSMISACSISPSLADEFKGKVEMSTEQQVRYDKQKWYPGIYHNDNPSVNSPPFFNLAPALVEHLAGTDRGPGGIRLLEKSRTKTINFREGPELVMNLLDRSEFKPRIVQPLSSRLFFTEKRLFLVSVDPVLLLVVPYLGDKSRYAWEQEVKPYGIVSAGFFQIFTERRRNASSGNFNIGVDMGSHIILSNVFNDASGIEVLSDKWSGARKLENVVADPSIPFKTIPAHGAPRFLRLVLKPTNP